MKQWFLNKYYEDTTFYHKGKNCRYGRTGEHSATFTTTGIGLVCFPHLFFHISKCVHVSSN